MDVYHNALFHGFEKRLEGLRKVKRYYKLDVMFYRTNLEDHSQMVSWMVDELLPYTRRAFLDYFTLEKEKEAFTLALVHDDAEMITDDPSFGDKMNMSPQQLSLLESDEEIAIEELASKYPETINGFNYRSLLLMAMNKDTKMAQFVSVADKAVAFGESLHEMYAGNECFIENSGAGVPVQSYMEIFPQQEKWRDWYLMGPLFRRRHPFLNKPAPLDISTITRSPTSKPHTEESVHIPTGYPIYDKWKEVILKHERGLELLVQQREFS